MKLTQLDQETYEAIAQLWNRTDAERPDHERGEKLLEYSLFEDGGASVWYIADTGIFILSSIVPGHTANFTPVSLYTANVDVVKAELKNVMREYDLRRMTATTPGPILAVQKNLRQLGFVDEGVLKDGTIYGGTFADTVIQGLYRSEVENEKPLPIAGQAARDMGKKRRRRRRRSRRKNKAPKGHPSKVGTDEARKG